MKLSTASCKNEYVRATLVITSMQLAVQVYMCIAAESMSNIYNNINIYKLSSIETRDGFLACVLYTYICTVCKWNGTPSKQPLKRS